MTPLERAFDDPNDGLMVAQSSPLTWARGRGLRWEQRCADGSMVIIRQRLAERGSEASEDDLDVYRYDIEYKAPHGQSRHRSDFDLHATVRASARRAHVAIYSAKHVSERRRLPQSIYSRYVDELGRHELEGVIVDVARELQATLQDAARQVGQWLGLSWNVIYAIASFTVDSIFPPAFSREMA